MVEQIPIQLKLGDISYIVKELILNGSDFQ